MVADESSRPLTYRSQRQIFPLRVGVERGEIHNESRADAEVGKEAN
jgi:hypothetical protein